MSELPYNHGTWITTYTGKQFDFADPQPDQIVIEDIAVSLSRTVRFRGMTIEPYSVAQHSVLVASLVPPEDALWGLLHDAAEAYVGDLPKPIKHHMGRAFRAVEDRILQVIGETFGLSWPVPDSVAVADRQMLVTEVERLMEHQSENWHLAYGFEPDHELPILPLTTNGAYRYFLATFHKLVLE